MKARDLRPLRLVWIADPQVTAWVAMYREGGWTVLEQQIGDWTLLVLEREEKS